MNKRGSEYTIAIAIECVLLIAIIAMLAMFVYKNPHEERINELKAIDLGLALDSVAAGKGDVYLDFDLGEGMFVEVENDRVKVYKKHEERAGEKGFSKNNIYEYSDLDEMRYEDLFIIKEENEIKLRDEL